SALANGFDFLFPTGGVAGVRLSAVIWDGSRLHRQSAPSSWISNQFAGGKLPITHIREEDRPRQFDPRYPARSSSANRFDFFFPTSQQLLQSFCILSPAV